jgi:hypothetical protein
MKGLTINKNYKSCGRNHVANIMETQ